MRETDDFYQKLEEPNKSCFMALRDIIRMQDNDITHELKYGMPFFCYKGKMFCYLWTHKKTGQPYIGIVEGKHFDQPFLIQEKRSRMKVMMLDAEKNLPVKRIRGIIKQALDLYKKGVIKTVR
ncbi:MAG: DUF1801 domain-containing protein [Flavipsychrobacter sp.]|nr:DUF1801 domain-containing protein [Flavipsychrobacter sp.]